MTMRRRAAAWKMGATAVAAAGLVGLGAPGEARAGDGEGIAVVALLGAFAVADIGFAAHDIDAASHNRLARDGWLIAETAVSVPQTLVFNTLLVGFNASDRDMGEVATFLGTIPTAGVTALTVHGIWGMADQKVDADALAGVSVLVGTNFALTASALGSAGAGRFHTRPVGVLETVLAAPGLGVGIYESSFERPERGAWIGLTAWSGALMAHGVVSMIVDGGRARRRDPIEEPVAKRAARATSFWPQTFTVAPTVVSDGVGRAPGLMASGTF